MTYSREKCRTDGRTGGQTDNGDFIGPSLERESKKGGTVYSAVFRWKESPWNIFNIVEDIVNIADYCHWRHDCKNDTLQTERKTNLTANLTHLVDIHLELDTLLLTTIIFNSIRVFLPLSRRDVFKEN